MPRTKKEKSLCSGCYHNDYNHGFMGVKECWSFKGAKVVKRIPIDAQRPPPYSKENARPMLSCYNKKGMVYVKPEVLTMDGYWKI